MGNLNVTTAHLRELASRQTEAAGAIAEAAAATQGTTMNMWSSHGTVCSATNMAVMAADGARRSACAAAAKVSSTLSEMLDTAAAQYDQTDSTQASVLGTTIYT
ncbi:ESX-1 secretion-associated protein [Mycobacterium sp. 141]|uniref:ESX-1 secretion-associated protein n=1 Tax=Mycobacterium sp. 141 TaxID=1120797 RepID=UPI00036DB3E4|nr:ESX-1 secretion-associated protein [Mycobacterium sp. 141]